MIRRIRSRRVFDELRTRGERVRSGPIRMTFVSYATTRPEVALALGRRFGNAVERNRGRRRLRAAFRAGWQSRSDRPDQPVLSGAFLLSGSRALLTAPFDSLVEAVEICLTRLERRLVNHGDEPLARLTESGAGT